ncbi:MAG TPA: DUF86 domain-containing protein [Thermoprotei archaeon]|nr:DUF86 domain-containing protein [Thermoprotei archaeon]
MYVRLVRQFELVKDYFRRFKEYFMGSRDIYAVERLAELLIQSFLDLGAMFLTFIGEAKPDTYREVMKVFSSKMKLSENDRRFLEDMAGFRNILIHRYGKIDLELEKNAFREICVSMPKILEVVEKNMGKYNVDPMFFEKLSPIFKKYGVRYAFIFGSYAKRGVGRDIDIAVSWNIDNALMLGRLVIEISDALNVDEDRIDLIHIESASKSLIKTIIIEGKLIYGDPGEAYMDLAKHYIEYLDMNETYRYIEEIAGKTG